MSWWIRGFGMTNYYLKKRCLRMLNLLFSVFLTLNITVVYAEDPAVLVQKKLSSIHTMSAKFNQTVKSKKRILSVASGTMALSRPNRFRWQTKSPMAQTVVADGQKVWIYDADLEQVTVSKQTQNLGAAGALFLSQTENAVAQDFTVTFQQEGAIEIFYLTAKSIKANFQHVVLYFKGPILQSIALDDQLGQHTLAHFSQIKLNQSEPDRLFKFNVPTGVDVVSQ